MKETSDYDTLLRELEALKAALLDAKSKLQETEYRLEEANDTIEAIRNGEVDALVVKADTGHQLYTLKSSDLAYRLFIEQMTTGAVTLNRNGNVLYCNSRFADMVNHPLEKVAGQPFCSFIADQDKDGCMQLLASSWTRSGLKREFELLISSGNTIPVLLSMQSLELDEGIFMSVIITDLSEQKNQQNLLQEKNLALQEAQNIARELNANLEQTVTDRTKELYSNQERLSKILETMAEGVVIVDLNGKLSYANPMAQKMLGLTESPRKDRSYIDPKWEIYKVDGSKLFDEEEPTRLTMKSGKPVYDFEIALHPPNKERVYISINAAPIRDENGKIIAGIATFTDVTIRRRDIQQKDDFISVASHELRTPITTLKASLQLIMRMKNDPNPGMLDKLLEQSNKSLNRVSVLINDLLNTTKMSGGQLPLNKSWFNVATLVSECCMQIRLGGVYKLVSEGDKTLEINADADKIEQVLVNLVNNAVKYAPKSKEIRINWRKEGSFVKILVIDKGPGISPDKVSSLFEKYYRVNNNFNDSGLGLGLFISAEIIKKHGGSIGVDSKLSEGSSFWFTLPL